MAVATYTDVAVAVGRPISSDVEQNQIEWWLTGAEMAIKARLGDLSVLDQNVLLYVEVEAVAAKVRRHGNLESSITVSVDDSSVTRRYESNVTSADITDDWWDLLNPAATVTAFTISPYRHRQQEVFRGLW